MAKYYIYGNSGGIDEVLKDIKRPKKTFSSIKDVFEHIVREYGGFVSMEELSVRYYGYDDRLEKDVYLIGTSRCGSENYIKKYGCPQFIRFMICL